MLEELTALLLNTTILVEAGLAGTDNFIFGLIVGKLRLVLKQVFDYDVDWLAPLRR